MRNRITVADQQKKVIKWLHSEDIAELIVAQLKLSPGVFVKEALMFATNM